MPPCHRTVTRCRCAAPMRWNGSGRHRRYKQMRTFLFVPLARIAGLFFAYAYAQVVNAWSTFHNRATARPAAESAYFLINASSDLSTIERRCINQCTQPTSGPRAVAESSRPASRGPSCRKLSRAPASSCTASSCTGLELHGLDPRAVGRGPISQTSGELPGSISQTPGDWPGSPGYRVKIRPEKAENRDPRAAARRRVSEC